MSTEKRKLVESVVIEQSRDPGEAGSVKGFLITCPYCKTKLAFPPITKRRLKCSKCKRKFSIV